MLAPLRKSGWRMSEGDLRPQPTTPLTQTNSTAGAPGLQPAREVGILRDQQGGDCHTLHRLGSSAPERGFALSEVIHALILTRRYIWLKVLADGFLETALEMHQGLDLVNRVILFFDRAIYYTAKGYEKG